MAPREGLAPLANHGRLRSSLFAEPDINFGGSNPKNILKKNGSSGGIRTPDQLINSQLLYH